MHNDKPLMLRQGDVQFIRIDSLPQQTEPKKDNVLFHGEATGHAHTVDAGEIFTGIDGVLYLHTAGLTTVSHQEHKPLTLTPGIYLVSQKRLYNDTNGWSYARD